MQLLNIKTAPMRLDISSKLGAYNIESPKPELNIEKQDSKIQVQNDYIKVNIDRTAMYESMGIYKHGAFLKKTAEESRQQLLRAIGEYSQDGEQMARTQGKAYESICRRKFLGDEVQLVTAHIPSVRPDISWQGGTVDVWATELVLNLNWKVNTTANIEYNRAHPQISVSQYQNVDITFTGTLGDINRVGIENAKKANIQV